MRGRTLLRAAGDPGARTARSLGGLQGQGAEVLISLDALVHEVDIGCQDREADSLASPQAP